MGKAFGRIALVFAAFVLLLSSCRDYRRISVNTMADIYADMLVADQWLNSRPELKRTADTTIFYGKIFQNYGYSFKDYDGSVNYYLHNPEKFQKIVDLTYEKVSAEYHRLEDVKKRIDFHDSVLAAAADLELPQFALDSITRARFFETPWFAKDTLDADSDSLALALDSLKVQTDSLKATQDTSVFWVSAENVRDSLAAKPKKKEVRPLIIDEASLIMDTLSGIKEQRVCANRRKL